MSLKVLVCLPLAMHKIHGTIFKLQLDKVHHLLTVYLIEQSHQTGITALATCQARHHHMNGFICSIMQAIASLQQQLLEKLQNWLKLNKLMTHQKPC